MMTTSTRVEDADIASLLERVEKATKADRDLDRDLCLGLSYSGYVDAPLNLRRAEDDWLDYECVEDGHTVQCSDTPPELTASIDAALALVERMLPGWKWGVASVAVKTGEKSPEGYPRYGTGFRAHVTQVSALRPMPSVAEGPTAPLAILVALLRSLSQGAGHEQ